MERVAAAGPAEAEPSVAARALAVLRRLGYTGLAPAALATERDSHREVVLVDRLVAALQRLNPGISTAHVHRALRELTGTRAANLAAANQRTYELLCQGAALDPRGRTRIRYIDLERPAANEFVVTWQLPVRGVTQEVVLDLVVFVNGIPLVAMVCEPAAASATADPSWEPAALAELWRWQDPTDTPVEPGGPRLLETVQLLVALGAQTAVYGSVLDPPQRFTGWHTAWPYAPDELAALVGRLPTAQDVLLCGMLAPPRLLDLLRNFVAFQADPGSPGTERTLSRSSEFLAVQRAVRSCSAPGNDTTAERGGVIWHALGAGGHRQYLLMAWLVGKLRRESPHHGRSFLLIGEDRGRALDLAQAVREAGAGVAEEVADAQQLQHFLRVPETRVVVVSAPELRTLLSDDFFALDAGFRPIVLVAEALGPHASGLLSVLRHTLPGADIFAFTSTPQTAPSHYLSRYSFAEAIAEAAVVPVYYEARPLDLPESRERTLALCRDVHAHFLRVVRPSGGKAQLLVRSPEVARLCKQTIDRLGGLVSEVYPASERSSQPGRSRRAELFISATPLPGDAVPATLQVTYLDAQLSGRALLRTVLAVNPPTPEKLFGLVVDYTGGEQRLPTCLDAFAAAEIADALRLPIDALRGLPEWHRPVLHFLTDSRNLYSIEQCLGALESVAQRRAFFGAFRRYARSLEPLLDLPAAQGFVAEIGWLGQVLLAAAARYRDARLNLAGCGPRVRQLIVEAVQRDGNQTWIERAELLTRALDDKLAALPTMAAKISELTYALRHEIELRFADSPTFFAGLREELARIVAAPAGQPERVFDQLGDLRARLASRLGSAVPVGLSATAAVVYEVLTGVEAMAAAEAQLRYGTPGEFVSLAVRIDELIAAHPSTAQQAIADHLLATGVGRERAVMIAARVIERLTPRRP